MLDAGTTALDRQVAAQLDDDADELREAIA